MQVSAPRKKLLYERSHTDAFFAEKVVLCYRCKTRHMVGENVLIATPTPENFTMSLIEQGDTPRENQISVQPESALIRPDGGPWQKTPTLMEEPDKGRLPLRKSFQSFRKYLRQICEIAKSGKVLLSLFQQFLLVPTNSFFWEEDWPLGYNSMKF